MNNTTTTTTTQKSPSLLIFLLYLIALAIPLISIADAGQRKVTIPDDLDDVLDDEEDEAWKQWGRRTSPPTPDLDPPPDLDFDFSNMDLSAMQEEMMKRHVGPTFGFVKLRLGVPRDRDSVAEIATRWNKVLKTGGVEATFMAVDLNTIMFTLMRGQDTMELKEFLLEQQEAYEVKIGDRAFRRHGDPSLDELMEKQHAEKHKADADEEEEEDVDEEIVDEELKDEL